MGDVNQDGYSDFAVVSRITNPNPRFSWSFLEDTLWLFRGKATGTPPVQTNPVRLIRNGPTESSGLPMRVDLQVTAGDFNGDGSVDLAVLETDGLVPSAGQQGNPILTAGNLMVFSNVRNITADRDLSQADFVIVGGGQAGTPDRLGTRPFESFKRRPCPRPVGGRFSCGCAADIPRGGRRSRSCHLWHIGKTPTAGQ